MAAKTAVCNETVVKCENLDLQVSVVLLSSKISLILQSCFTKVQRKSTGNSHDSSNSAIDKLG